MSRSVAAVAAAVILVSWGSPLLLAQGRTLRPISSIDGKDLYRAYCAQCHGADGKGTGPRAAALKKPPADLTRIAERAGGEFNQEAVIQYIMGIRPGGKVAYDPVSGQVRVMTAEGPADMPAWGHMFRNFWPDQPERMRFVSLAKYLKSIQSK